jgi:hypothetical protein
MDYTAMHPRRWDSSDNKTFENVTKLKFLVRSIINQIYIHEDTESCLLEVFIFLTPIYSIKHIKLYYILLHHWRITPIEECLRRISGPTREEMTGKIYVIRSFVFRTVHQILLE